MFGSFAFGGGGFGLRVFVQLGYVATRATLLTNNTNVTIMRTNKR